MSGLLTWDTSCLDWRERIMGGQSLMPELPLYEDEADEGLSLFNQLQVMDAIGQPNLGEAGGVWFKDIVRAFFGAVNPRTYKRMIRHYFIQVPKKNGKALALDTPIATPTGFTPMGELRVGDWVIDSDGRPTRVSLKSDIFVDHECYEVEFSTGEKIVCDAGHLWVTDAHSDRDKQRRSERSNPLPSAKTAADIAKSVKVKSGQLEINNHRTALCGALDLPTADLPIDPYVLGLWIGDGDSNAPVITSSFDDAAEIHAHILDRGVAARRVDNEKNARISMAKERGEPGSRGGMRHQLAALGILGSKRIPMIYLRGDREQRTLLLQGLMDSDGTISLAGQASFATTNQGLRDDVVQLVNSLGLKASFCEKRATINGVDCGPCWEAQFWPFDKIDVFRLQRKKVRQRMSGARNSARSTTRQIVAMRPVPSVPTQCIMVESDTHQFLVGNSLIPTHNTLYMAALMLTALLMNNRPNAVFLIVAPTREQAAGAFNRAAQMAGATQVLKDRFHVVWHEDAIEDRLNGSELRIKTFDTNIVTGAFPAGVLIDEKHLLGRVEKAERVMGQLTGGMLPDPSAFLIDITTQSDLPPAGVYKADLEIARQVRDGKIKKSMLPIIYEFPEDIATDPNQWQDRKFWRIVNPNEASIDIDRLVEEWDGAKLKGEAKMREWASQHLNIEMGVGMRVDGWKGARFWEGQTLKKLTLEMVIELSDVLVMGVDDGGLDDLLGCCVLGRAADDVDELGISKGDWLCWTHGWAHEQVLEERKSIAQLLRDGAEAFEITISDDRQEHFEEVAALADRLNSTGKFCGVAVDPATVPALVTEFAAVGVTLDGDGLLKPVKQGMGLMQAIKGAEIRLSAKSMWHHGSTMMNWCVTNLKIEPTATAIRPVKISAGDKKIDYAMAMFDAVTLMALNPSPKKKPTFAAFVVG